MGAKENLELIEELQQAARDRDFDRYGAEVSGPSSPPDPYDRPEPPLTLAELTTVALTPGRHRVVARIGEIKRAKTIVVTPQDTAFVIRVHEE